MQNASATGGLRGGNTELALSQFSPNLLQQLIQQQFSNLGGISNNGLNAAGTGTFGANSSNQITSLLGQQGAAQAGNALAQGNAFNNGLNGVASGLGGLYSKYGSNNIFGGGASTGNASPGINFSSFASPFENTVKF